MEEKTVGKQSHPSSFASQKFSGTNDFELTNSCKKSLVHPCLTVLFNLRARRVCVHDAYFWPRWCALEKGDDMCSNIAARRGIIAIVPPAYKYVLYGFFGWNGGPCFTALFIRFSTNNRLPETSFSHCQSSIQSTRSSLSLSLSFECNSYCERSWKDPREKNARLVSQPPRQILTNVRKWILEVEASTGKWLQKIGYRK